MIFSNEINVFLWKIRQSIGLHTQCYKQNGSSRFKPAICTTLRLHDDGGAFLSKHKVV